MNPARPLLPLLVLLVAALAPARAGADEAQAREEATRGRARRFLAEAAKAGGALLSPKDREGTWGWLLVPDPAAAPGDDVAGRAWDLVEMPAKESKFVLTATTSGEAAAVRLGIGATTVELVEADGGFRSAGGDRLAVLDAKARAPLEGLLPGRETASPVAELRTGVPTVLSGEEATRWTVPAARPDQAAAVLAVRDVADAPRAVDGDVAASARLAPGGVLRVRYADAVPCRELVLRGRTEGDVRLRVNGAHDLVAPAHVGPEVVLAVRFGATVRVRELEVRAPEGKELLLHEVVLAGPADGPQPPTAAELEQALRDLDQADPARLYPAILVVQRGRALAAVGKLVKLLQPKPHPDFFVRQAATRALGELKACDAVPALAEVLLDKSPLVVQQAQTSIRAITGLDLSLAHDARLQQRRKARKDLVAWWAQHESEVRARCNQADSPR